MSELAKDTSLRGFASREQSRLARAAEHWPLLRFVDLDKCEKHVKPIALFGTLRCTPVGFDLCECRFMIFVGADRSDFHAPFPLVLRYGQRVDAIVFGVSADELHEGHLPTEIKGDHQAIVSSCNLEPVALAV